jgi:hypothetical protein
MIPQTLHHQRRNQLNAASSEKKSIKSNFLHHIVFHAIQTGNATLFAEAMAMAYTQQNIEISRGERLDGTGTTTVEGRNRDRDLECTFLTRAEDFGEEEEKECTGVIGPRDRHKDGEGEKTRAREKKQKQKQKHRGQQKQDQTARRRSADSYTFHAFNIESESNSKSAAYNKSESRSGGERAESRILGPGRDEDGRRREETERRGPSISELSALRDLVIEAKEKS